MSEKNTILERIKADAPNVIDKQQTLTYVPLADLDMPGIVKPDGEQFVVDNDGTLHVQQQYITRIQLVTQQTVDLIVDPETGKIVRDDDGNLKEDVSYTLSKNADGTPLYKYDEKGNSIVTVLLSDGTISKFITNKGDRGLPYLIYTAVLPASAIDADEITLYEANMSRTPVMGDLIFAVFGQSGDEQSYVGILSFRDAEYGNNKIQYKGAVKFVVETTGKQGNKGDTGAKGDTGISIQSITFDKVVEGGNQYKITLTDGSTYNFVSPVGPEGPKGNTGDPFSISYVYNSVYDMVHNIANSGDSSTTGPTLKDGDFVVISTGNVDDTDNAKLYVKDSTATKNNTGDENGWRYITDLSGAIGMTGPKGDPGDTLSIQLGMEGVIQSNRVVFEVQDANSYLYSRKNLQKYLVTMYLPVVGTLDNSLPVNITFGDATYNLYNYLSGSSSIVKIGDLMPVSSYDHETGFFFTCELMFMQNSDYVGFVMIPPTITAKQLERLINDNGTVVTDLSDDGTQLNIHLSADVVNKLSKVLVQPMVAPGESELVGLTAQGSQENVKLGGTLKKVNDTLDVEENGLHGIRYDVLQSDLTDEQKATARSNIGAGASSFSGSYNDLQNKPKVNTNNSESQTPQNAEELGQELKLHKISKTGKLADAIEDDTHKAVTMAEKAKWNDVDNKLEKVDGVGTGTHTFEYIIASGIKLNNMIAGANDVSYFVTADNEGHFKKREAGEVLNDIGGTSVQVGGVMAHDVNFVDTGSIKPIVTETTNDAGKTIKNVEYKFDGNKIIIEIQSDTKSLTKEQMNILKSSAVDYGEGSVRKGSPFVYIYEHNTYYLYHLVVPNFGGSNQNYEFVSEQLFGNNIHVIQLTISSGGAITRKLIDTSKYAELSGDNNFTGSNYFSYGTYISGTNASLYVLNDSAGTSEDVITLFSTEQSADLIGGEENWTGGYSQGRIYLYLREKDGQNNVLRLTLTPLGVEFMEDGENTYSADQRYISWYDIYHTVKNRLFVKTFSSTTSTSISLTNDEYTRLVNKPTSFIFVRSKIPYYYYGEVVGAGGVKVPSYISLKNRNHIIMVQSTGVAIYTNFNDPNQKSITYHGNTGNDTITLEQGECMRITVIIVNTGSGQHNTLSTRGSDGGGLDLDLSTIGMTCFVGPRIGGGRSIVTSTGGDYTSHSSSDGDTYTLKSLGPRFMIYERFFLQ